MSLLAKISIVTLLLTGLTVPAFSHEYWIPIEKPTTRNLNKIFFLDSLRGWVVGDSGTILHTADGAQGWAHQQSGIIDHIYHIFMLNAGLGWALAINLRGPYGTIILKTTNGGSYWEQFRFLENRFCYTMRFLDSLHGWIGGGSFLRTTDGGVTWFEVCVDSSLVAHMPVHEIQFLSRQLGFAVGGFMDQAAVVWKTTDGECWISTEVGAEPLNDMHSWDSLNILAVGGDLEFGVALVRTSNGGDTWEYVFPNILGEGRALAFRTPSEAWSALGFSGTYMHSIDSGRTWTDMYTPDSSGVYDVVFTNPRHGIMVGKRGTILKYNSTVDVVDDPYVAVPSTLKLYQNFPNPFNPTTLIRYDLPGISYVTLAIYDMLGREVQSHEVGIQRAGSHLVPFSGAGLASGVYFYTVTVRSLKASTVHTVTGKMILLR